MGSTFSPFKPVLDNEAFCQGDIVYSPQTDQSLPKLGMIVTADCDIAQDKAGNMLSLLEITEADKYIRESWGAREIERASSNPARLWTENYHCSWLMI